MEAQTGVALTLLAFGLMPARALEGMSLKQAVEIALDHNKSIAASVSAEMAAQSRIAQARAGLLPKANYSESWAHSDNPVFVFSSLLTQHQFGLENFQIGSLNRPDSLSNFQSLVTADQPIYDGGQSRHAIRAAKLGQEIAGESRRLSQTEVIAGVVQAYFDVLLSAEQLNSADGTLRSAQADLEQAQALRESGMSTDVDVLSIRVHLAGVRERRIRRAADLDVARAALNQALGLPLDTPHSLTTPLTPFSSQHHPLAAYEAGAVGARPEARQARQAVSLAENQAAEARSALLPQVGLHAAFEADRQTFYERGGANWLVSLGMRWNLFNGLADKARIEEGRSLLRRSEAQADYAASAIRLQVRRAYAELEAAEQRI
jgi:outer membrane protein TolC